MRVAGQILQNLLRSAEGRLHIDDPFDSPRLLAQGRERGRLREPGHLAVELSAGLLESLPQISQKQISEPAAQYPHGEKERLFRHPIQRAPSGTMPPPGTTQCR